MHPTATIAQRNKIPRTLHSGPARMRPNATGIPNAASGSTHNFSNPNSYDMPIQITSPT